MFCKEKVDRSRKREKRFVEKWWSMRNSIPVWGMNKKVLAYNHA